MKTIEKNSRENNKQDLLDKLENTKTMRDNLIVRKDNQDKKNWHKSGLTLGMFMTKYARVKEVE